MRSHTLLLRSLLLLAGVFLAGLAIRSVHAQRLEDGAVDFEVKARQSRFRRNDLFKGTKAANPKDKEDQEAAEIAAKEVVYPLYWLTSSNQPQASGKLNKQVVDFDSRLAQMTKFKAATEIYQQMFCRQVAERCQEVILRGKPIAGVSAARILSLIPERRMDRGSLQTEKAWFDDVQPRLADGNAQYMADTFLPFLENPRTNDGVKYYLLRTFASLLGLPKQTPPLLKKETEEKAVLAAMKLVEKKGIFPRATPFGEVEGYKILRREAVKVVAQSRTPVVGKDRPALVLAKVAGNDQGVVPSPRLDERIEALVGLAHMTAAAAKFPDLQPEYAAMQMARCVADFGVKADENRGKKTTERIRPWKVDAARMIEALDAVMANVKTPAVQEIVKNCLEVLLPIEKGGAGNGGRLHDWLSTHPAPVKGLFKSGEDSTIRSLTTEKTEKTEK